MRITGLALIGALTLSCACATAQDRLTAPAMRPALNPLVTVPLTDGAVLHMTPLPLGRIIGHVNGSAQFDSSNTRAVFLAVFDGTALHGDWRHANPVQAFLLDMSRRSLIQLTEDGRASAVRWSSATRIRVRDGSLTRTVGVDPPQPTAKPAFGIALFSTLADAQDSDVTPNGTDRIAVFRRDARNYAVTQIGAIALHGFGAASNGAFAILGDYAAWIDRNPRSGFLLSRLGPDDGSVPAFAGSAYGDALAPILPLGHFVYQGAYRNGVAYFALTVGLQRIVAATADLASFSFPSLPANPEYTVGDGLGAGADGALYFAGPEDGALQYWRAGRYLTLHLTFPPGYSGVRRLFDAMADLSTGETNWPPVRPDQDATDADLLEWRVFPVGDETGAAWVASYLGRSYVADSSGRFREIEPAFPFAVLGRTDDGRLWGVSPMPRTVDGPLIATAASELWSSRDAKNWNRVAQLDGDAGAVGEDHRAIWVAMTKTWSGRPMIAVTKIESAQPASFITGGSYSGEQLLFASLADGFYLIWGSTPATRASGDEGPLSAFRIDEGRLAATDAGGSNAYMRDRLDSAADASLAGAPQAAVPGADALVKPSLGALAYLSPMQRLTLVTNAATSGADDARVTRLAPDVERAFEIKYGERPYPIATVSVTPVSARRAFVDRSLEYGPLHATGSRELWEQDASGTWRLRSLIETWKY